MGSTLTNRLMGTLVLIRQRELSASLAEGIAGGSREPHWYNTYTKDALQGVLKKQRKVQVVPDAVCRTEA